jgi:hypothetical protein
MVQTSYPPKPATLPPDPIPPLPQAPKTQGKPTKPAELLFLCEKTGR